MFSLVALLIQLLHVPTIEKVPYNVTVLNFAVMFGLDVMAVIMVS